MTKAEQYVEKLRTLDGVEDVATEDGIMDELDVMWYDLSKEDIVEVRRLVKGDGE